MNSKTFSVLFFLLYIVSLNVRADKNSSPLHKLKEGKEKITLKINIGGDTVGDFVAEESVFLLDDYPRFKTKDPIRNTDQPELYQTQRRYDFETTSA